VVDHTAAHKLCRPVSPDWTCAGFTSYTVSVPASRSDTRLLLTATAAVVAAGVIVAVVLLFATGRSNSPTKYKPFAAGPAKAIKQQLEDGGPYYVPDPFGGNKSILFALESGQVVALSNILPGTTDCTMRWKGSVNRFQDCHGDRFTSVQLDRFKATIDQSGSGKGLLFVDLRKKLPAPSP
jgi:hypothetical protein